MMYEPHKWVLVKIDEYYKVLGAWYGGYLGGNSWRLNSGVVKAEQDENYWYFHGHSGSIYKCHKDSYGVTSASGPILTRMIENGKEKGIDISIVEDVCSISF